MEASTNSQLLLKIKSDDPEFWKRLMKLATGIKNNDYKYLNDHRYHGDKEPEPEVLEFITICQTYNKDGSLKKRLEFNPGDVTGEYPPSWMMPGPETNYSAMCKNPLYLDVKNRPHLSRWALGVTFDSDEIKNLRRGLEVHQEADFGRAVERNFTVTAKTFVEIVLA